mmetsp:Transcript_7761/g.23709  ORF Transcript_7761/g.23709 Transcript_7761/m.23709 type:complete len:495 (+) Transcript_7761:121-1605(+)
MFRRDHEEELLRPEVVSTSEVSEVCLDLGGGGHAPRHVPRRSSDRRWCADDAAAHGSALAPSRERSLSWTRSARSGGTAREAGPDPSDEGRRNESEHDEAASGDWVAGRREDEGGGEGARSIGLLGGVGDGDGLVEAGVRAEILERVEEGALAAGGEWDLGVLSPREDSLGRDARGEHGLPEGVGVDGGAGPVDSLGEGLEGRGGGVDAVVAGVGLGGEAEGLPVVGDELPERAGGGVLGVGRAEHVAAEVLPGERGGGPLDEEVVDGGLGLGELAAHGHVEAVNDVETVDVAAVEAAAELDEVDASLERGPLLVEAVAVDPELGAGVARVVDHALRDRLGPRQAERLLELGDGLGRRRELRRLEHDRLLRDRAVVRVDQHLLVDRRPRDLALRHDRDPGLAQLRLDQRLDRLRHGVRLHEHERRALLARPRDLQRPHPLLHARQRGRVRVRRVPQHRRPRRQRQVHRLLALRLRRRRHRQRRRHRHRRHAAHP